MKKEYLLALISVFAWGTMAPLGKIQLEGYTNMEVLGYGSIIGALFLFAVLVIKGEGKMIAEYKADRMVRLGILGFVGYFLYSAFYYEGLKILTSQTACVLNYLWPIVSVIVSGIFLGERINKRMMTAIILSFAGVIIMMLPKIQESDFIRGSVFCMIGAVLYGCFNVLNKKAGGNQTINMMIYLGTGAICAFLISIPKGLHIPTGMDIIGFLWLGIVIDGLGFLFWAMAMQGERTGTISNFAYATPVISLLLSAIFLREQISLNMISGIVLVFAGILIQVYQNVRLSIVRNVQT